MNQVVRVRWRQYGPALTVAASLVVAVIRRAQGFTAHQLFFDDAWAALPAHEPLGTALQMSVSTPGWTIAERAWIQLHPAVSAWAQAPAFFFALVASLAGYPLLRRFGASSWAAAVGSSLLMLSPMVTTYATRVKPYSMEMAVAIGLYFLCDNVRRDPSLRRWLVFGLASVAGCAASFGLMATVGALWLVLIVQSRRDAPVLRRALFAGAVSAVLTAGIAAPYVINRPPSLGDNWVSRGYMVGYTNAHLALHNCVQMIAGFTHSLVNYGFSPEFASGVNYFAVWVVFVLTLLMGIVLTWGFRSLAPDQRARLAPVAAIIPVSVLAAVVDAFPFGDGRTDIVMYPALTVLLVVVGEAAVTQLAARPRVSTRGLRLAIALLSVAGGVDLVWRGPALYPTIEVRHLYALIRHQWHAGDVIVVPAFVTYSWADAGLTPWHLEIGGATQWPQGFRVVSDTPDVIFPINWTGPDNQLVALRRHHHRIWCIGYDLGAWDPYLVGGRFAANTPMGNFTQGTLEVHGWRTSWFPSYSINSYATPMTYQPNKPMSPF